MKKNTRSTVCWLMSVSGQLDARRKRDFPFISFFELCSQELLSWDIWRRIQKQNKNITFRNYEDPTSTFNKMNKFVKKTYCTTIFYFLYFKGYEYILSLVYMKCIQTWLFVSIWFEWKLSSPVMQINRAIH